MRKKTKAFLLASVLLLFAALCLSCAVPIPLMIPIVETPTIIPIEPVLV